ncbi:MULTISPECIES: hypothetical protein [Sinorhizobium]|uniref:hypothetical protein n=1 Tax=Sinorhizobium TaxID=28105 RepID=UPI000BE9AAA2|nr:MULTISPECIES: hypothetical protein [Sinorhizobium]PDT48360.1 hypothetical protein CO664_28920 [Sinorhizobium sp. NG07B]POH30001.1 hypothetical protein ATY30_13555 [Sinorhizobium americanum]
MFERIPVTFLSHAAAILADSNSGMSGNNIVTAFNAYALDFDKNIPHATYPYDAPNKRTAFLANLQAFEPKQQYKIIKELCDHRSFGFQKREERKALKLQLATKYHQFAELGETEINETLIEETRHWLQDYPDSLSLFNQALQKYDGGVFNRNVLDDIRLSLEKLLRKITGVDKSLEHQVKPVGGFIKDKGGSKELANMFMKLLDYYGNYQNEYVKHDDAVIEEEIEIIFEITASFMKHLVRLQSA